MPRFDRPRFEGRAAVITGAARGQGRSHAVRLAAEGADVIALDICHDIDTVAYDLATSADLKETERLVAEQGRRVVTAEVDVRDAEALTRAIAEGARELGGVDIVLANAGIGLMDATADARAAFRDQLDVNLVGVWNTVQAAAPLMIEQGRGGAIVLTSSTQGLTGRGGDGSGGLSGYCAAKHGVVGLMRTVAHWLAPHNIRVNTVHPTGVSSPMVLNDAVGQMIAEKPHFADVLANLMPVELVDVSDISNAIAWLVSDEARYVSGVTLPVDAGFTVK
jgi:SDR family mycofactocin-dependent oxidoreductase